MEDKRYENLAIAIKGLQAEINNLKKEVAELKEDKAVLKAENAKLKEQNAKLKANSATPKKKTVFDGIEKAQKEKISSLNDIIKRKEVYISRLEHSLAKYNYKEAQLLKKLE